MGGLPQEGFYTVAGIDFNRHLRGRPIARPSGDVKVTDAAIGTRSAAEIMFTASNSVDTSV